MSEELKPLAWIYEDTLPKEYPYDAMFPHSRVREGVRMFPVYGPAPEAGVEPVAFRFKEGQVWHPVSEVAPIESDRNRVVYAYLHPATPAAVPEGWVLVPREPTPEMIQAIRNGYGWAQAYKDCIAAAPPPASAEDAR
jgi:hypothetical protein